jgi:hypothetical protein
MGAAFSTIENNYIHDIWVKRQFNGYEIAGIKFHAALDTQIRRNRICRVGRGMWLDWMAQGTRLSNNLLYENDMEDVFFEVNHGPYLVDNNIFGSPINVQNESQGGAYVHNLFAGVLCFTPERNRYTPYHLPHQTDVAGLSIILNGDDRYYNNLFMPVDPDKKRPYGQPTYSQNAYPNFMDGNAYYNRTVPPEGDKHFVSQPDFVPNFRIEENGKEVYVSFAAQELSGAQTDMVTTERLGKAKFPKAAYEQPDGSPIVVDTDYTGMQRKANPTPGPFEELKAGDNRVKVW